jgi:hypothetical protein
MARFAGVSEFLVDEFFKINRFFISPEVPEKLKKWIIILLYNLI